MRGRSTLLVAAAALALALLVAVAPRFVMGPERAVRDTISLADSLEPLRQDFNRHDDRPRILALLSPSCPRCFDGAQALEELLASHPGTGLRLEVVWERRLGWDLPQKVRKRGRELFGGDPRAAFFWDPANRAAGDLAAALGWGLEVPPWDVYLVFAPGSRWEEAPPTPLAWYHQQRGAYSESYRTGEALLAGLGEALERAAEGAFQVDTENAVLLLSTAPGGEVWPPFALFETGP